MKQLTTGSGASVQLINYGAAIAQFHVPLGDGSTHNVSLGFEDEEAFKTVTHPYFGASIGRVGNRIRGARITLDGETYELAKNNGANALHGGKRGFDKVMWEGPATETRGEKACAVFRMTSKDGEEGYPGTLDVLAAYTLETKGKQTVLTLEFEAKLADGSPKAATYCGLTNHSFFNVGKRGTLDGTQLTLPTARYIEVDSASIPSGKIGDFPGVRANVPVNFQQGAPSIDHCFVLEEPPADIPLDTREKPMHACLRMYDPETKLHLDINSTEPAVQVFTMDKISVKEGGYGTRAGLAVEPQRYIDAVSHDAWRHMMTLRKGQTYGSRMEYIAYTD